MARRLAVFVIVGTVLVALCAGVLPAGAGEAPPTTEPTPTTLPSGDSVGHIVLRPNYGHAPTGPNDRGGWQQLLVFGLLIGGVGAVGGLAWRDSRRKRRAAAAISAESAASATP